MNRTHRLYRECPLFLFPNLLNTYMGHRPFWETNSYSSGQKKRFVEPEVSLPRVQEPVDCSLPETDESHPRPTILLL